MMNSPEAVLRARSQTPEWHSLPSGQYVEIGSVTKTVTAAAFAVLVKEGRLDPDTPLNMLLPAARTASDMTPRHLIEHTSGLSRLPPGIGRRTDPYARFDREALRASLADIDALRESAPGEQRNYSNYGYAVLGAVLEEVTGSDWYTVVRSLVLDPLSLPDIRLDPPMADRLVRRNLLGRPRRTWSMAAMTPAGGLWATVPALLHYGKTMLLLDQLGIGHPGWSKGPRATWHNGGMRDSSIIVIAAHDDDPRVGVIARLSRDTEATTERGIELLRTTRRNRSRRW